MMLSLLNEEVSHEDEQLRSFGSSGKVTFLLLTSISGTPVLMILMMSGPYKLNFRAPLPLILFSEPGRR
jgi:DNA replication terminus site-binding protein